MQSWVTVFVIKHPIRQNAEASVIRLVRQTHKCRNAVHYESDPFDLEFLQNHVDRFDVLHVEEFLNVNQDILTDRYTPTDLSVRAQRDDSLFPEVNDVRGSDQPIRGEVVHLHDVVEVFDSVSEFNQQTVWQLSLLELSSKVLVKGFEGFDNVARSNVLVDVIKAVLLDSTLLKIW